MECRLIPGHAHQTNHGNFPNETIIIQYIIIANKKHYNMMTNCIYCCGAASASQSISPRLMCVIWSVKHWKLCRRFWHATHNCVAPYVDILHRRWFWAKSAASGSVRWCCFRSCWTMLSHVMRGRPSCLLQSAGGEANRILLASALSSMRTICPNRVRRRDWIIAVTLGCFVGLRTSSFRTNWYHLMPSSIRRHHWSSASILRASVLDIAHQFEPYMNIGKIHVLWVQ